MSRIRRSSALIASLTLALLATSCSSDASDAQAEVQAVESTTTSTAPTTTSTPATTQAAASPEPVALTGTAVESLLVDLPTENGWLMASGSWTSDVFSVGVEWTSPVDLYLEQAADHFVQLRPIAGGPPIFLFEPFEVASPQGRIAVRRPFDLATIADNPTLEVQDQTSGTPASADVTVVGERVEDAFTFPCPYEAELSCSEGFFMRAWQVHLPHDTQIRLVAADPDLPIAVATYGDANGPGTNAELARQLAASVRTGETAETSPTFISAVSPQEGVLPAGSLQGRIGTAAVVGFDFDEPVDNWRRVFSGYRTLGLSSSSGPQASVFVSTFEGQIDPEAEQVFGMVEDPSNFLSEAPQGVAQVEEWLGQLLAIVDSGETSFGDVPAAWWDVTVDDTVDSSPCRQERWFDPDAPCVDHLVNELFYLTPGGVNSRMIYVPEPELWIEIDAQGPDVSLDDALAAAAPLLNNLTISAVAEG